MKIRADYNLRIVMRRRPAPLTSVATAARPELACGSNPAAQSCPLRARRGNTKSCQDTF
jgi:hypothetical protein